MQKKRLLKNLFVNYDFYIKKIILDLDFRATPLLVLSGFPFATKISGLRPFGFCRDILLLRRCRGYAPEINLEEVACE